MSFTDWFALGMKKNAEVNIKKIKTESIPMGAMAVNRPSEAAAAISRIVDQKNSRSKILLVQDGNYSSQVCNYALKMAQRLDCEIVAFDVTDSPLLFSGEKRIRESDRFIDMARKNSQSFAARAHEYGIHVSHIMDIGVPDECVARVCSVDPGIRYVLSRPEKQKTENARTNTSVKLVNLQCARV